jgi:hypothetical protein
MGLGRAIRCVTGKTAPSAERAKADPVQLPEEPAGIPPNVDFNAIYEAFSYKYTNDPEERSRGRTRGVFHPSSGLHPKSGLCPRSVIFELVFAPMSPTQIPGFLAKILDMGSNRHVGLQQTFKNMAALGFMGIVHAESEVACVHPTLPIQGHMDELVTTNVGWRYALDFKTWSEANCAKTFEPEWKHRIQLNTYMGIMGIRTGYMIYENKNNQKWLGPPNKFRVNFSNELYEETEQFCRDVLTEVGNEQMPPFLEKVCKANLMFCAYFEVCQQENNGAVRWEDYDMRDEDQKRRHRLAVIQP